MDALLGHFAETKACPNPAVAARRGFRFGNALLGWELLRVSRRTGALTIGRFAFGAALLGVMWVLWSARYSHIDVASGDITQIAKQLQHFADDFSLTFFIVQLVLVLLLTPIFVAGSVFEERDTRSGEVLLTTDLTRREIFYGKFLARVVQVMMVVAAGMPVLALTLLWGGVSITFIIIGYAATFLCIFSAGAMTASVAGSSETMREAVLKAYAYIIVFDVLVFPASPFVLIPMARNEVASSICCGGIFLPVQLTITFVSLRARPALAAAGDVAATATRDFRAGRADVEVAGRRSPRKTRCSGKSVTSVERRKTYRRRSSPLASAV